MNDERTPYRNPNWIPDFAELSATVRQWVPMVLEIEAIDAELQELAATEKEIRGLRPTREEFRESLRASFAEYRQRHVQRVTKFLAENLTARSPLARIERLNHLVPSFIVLEHFEEAEAALPDQLFGVAEDKKRVAELSKISKHRAKLEARRAELVPPPYLRLDRLGVLRDVRRNFVDEWTRKQSECREACDALGLGLQFCGADVRWAYQELGIASYINEKRGLLAAVQ